MNLDGLIEGVALEHTQPHVHPATLQAVLIQQLAPGGRIVSVEAMGNLDGFVAHPGDGLKEADLNT